MSSLKERIISLVSENEDGIKIGPVAKILQENPNTVKSEMYRLSKEGVLITKFRGLKGFFGINPALQKSTDGIDSFGLPKIQNLCTCANVSNELQSFNQTELIPNNENPIWKVRTIVGAKSKKISIFMSGEHGYEWASVYIILSSKIKELNAKYGLNLALKDFSIENIELFVDICGVAISNNSFTVEDLSSTLVKFYSKKNKVRVEQRSSVPLPLDFFFTKLSNPILLNYVRSVNDGWNKIELVSKNLQSGMQSNNYYQKQILSEIKNLKKKELKQ